MALFPRPEGRFPFRLAAVSLEGALLNSSGAISRGNSVAVTQLRRIGVQVMLVCNASFDRAVPFHDQLGLERSPVICYGGALAASRDGKEVWHTAPIQDVLVPKILKLSDGWQVTVLYHAHPGVILVRERTRESALWESKNRLSLTLVREMGRARLLRCLQLSKGPVQIDLLGAAPAIAELTQALRDQFPGKLDYSGDDGHLQLRTANLTGLRAVTAITTRFGLSPEQVIAFGNHRDDAPLLSWSGAGVALGHPSDEEDAAHAFADSVMQTLVEGLPDLDKLR